jgi:aspartate/methionine/tyrosine aminotransferase
MQNISSDIEIYSFSKMFGLSGLRVGYCVVHNTDYYNDILSYIETKTVGVSSISQGIIYDILTRDKDIEKNFYIKSANDIRECFSKFDKIKDLLEPRHSHNGMFGWFVNKGNVDFDSLKIKVLDGKYFGSPGHVRINMAAGIDTIDKVIDIIERSRNEQI